ncbi:hypothetical protein [Paenibacillus elgii]|uniref:hypothetical protein n=1 Tax=Paenibacillus elgii TaxID=189691 RepID=UPI0013D29960|nr:hypothetical protein [Paenibacillus elgii]
MKKSIVLTAALMIVILAALWAYMTWTSPYKLPPVSSDVPWTSYQLDFSKEEKSFRNAKALGEKPEPPVLPLTSEEAADRAYAYALSLSKAGDGKRDERIRYLQEAVKLVPRNLAYSTPLRREMAAAGQGEAFVQFMDGLKEADLPQVRLQKAMSLVDRLQEPTIGTASLGQLSYLSIEVLDKVLEDNPYDWMAHYARGVNNLYWPVGLQRIDKSIQDLAFCVAVAHSFADRSPVLWPKAYTALGDALVKKGDVKEGMQVWKDGLKRFPEHEELKQRVQAGNGQAEQIVAKERGMEQFQRPAPDMTDFSVIWNK